MAQIGDHEIKLSDEILLVLCSKELEIPKFHGTSSQLCYRRLLVDWLAVISEKLFLSHGILHLSVVYMDIMMEKWEFSKKSQLNLLALCCLWIAGIVCFINLQPIGMIFISCFIAIYIPINICFSKSYQCILLFSIFLKLL